MPATRQKKVTVIPADIQMTERDIRKQTLRVAPYCRVSTKSEEQESSYEAQIEYYTEKVNSQPNWTMVDMFADAGITGTSTKKRKDFQRMIKACKKGKVDLIITKSVSRFCRNTLDGLVNVRDLKGMGVGVFFEKENINTMFMDNEMIITFMMSQAQAESESMSGNIKWAHRKNFKEGKVYYHYAGFLGYRRGENNLPEVDPEQAEIVRRIFARYLVGHSVAKIITDLENDGIKTARGKEHWVDGTIRGMLRNEKYAGDAILQKTFIENIFSHRSVKNTGQLPKYHVHDCHPAIIDKFTFQKVQEEMARRGNIKKATSTAKTELSKYSGKYALTELMVCGNCGTAYRRVIWTQKGVKRAVWRCISRLEHGKKFCKQSPTLDEDTIHAAVVAAMNEMFNLKAMREMLADSITTALAGQGDDMSIPAIDSRLVELRNNQLELVQFAASSERDNTDYDEAIYEVSKEISALLAKKKELEQAGQTASSTDSHIENLAETLSAIDCGILTFDEMAVRQLVASVKVMSKEKLIVRFKDGTEIEQII